MHIANLALYILLLAGAVLSYSTRKLTLAGAITGVLTGLLVYYGAGYTGMAMLALFFIAGSWATGWQIQRKNTFGAAEAHKGRRTAGQVIANGGVTAILGAMALYAPARAHLLQIMMAGSLAAATADTLSSELGTVYGTRFYNVVSFKKDERGLDGVVSLEGTLLGAVGAAFIAIVYAVGFGFGIAFFWIVLAGIIGNLADSVLGVALERKRLIGNNVVNFLNTLIGALACLLISRL